MAQNLNVMSLEAIKYLCSVINQVVDLPTTVINDTNLATNTTFSSVHIDAELTNLEAEIKAYINTALAGLNKLTKEIIMDKALVLKDNVLYLYKDDTDTTNNYMQMMLINGVAVELGTTQVNMSDFYDKTEADNKFALKIDLDTLTTSFNELKTKVDELGNKSEIVSLTKAQHTELVSNGVLTVDGKEITYDENGYYIITDDTESFDSSKIIKHIDNYIDGSLDFNDFIEEGIYTFGEFKNQLPLNSPPVDATQGIFGELEVIKYRGKYIFIKQQLTNIISGKPTIYIRRKVVEQDTWGDWYIFNSCTVPDAPIINIELDNRFTKSNTASGVRYVIRNGICYVSWEGVGLASSSTTPVTVGTGTMPKPAMSYNANMLQVEANSQSPTNPTFLSVNSNGDLRLYSPASLGHFWGTLSYPVAE
jgi:hypothetical protein